MKEVAKLTAEEWYFFSFRDRKYAMGSWTNRATKTGYWKATGKDKVVHEAVTRAVVRMRKTLVFYLGRAPNSHKTTWVMHEFRLETPNSQPKEDWVLCKVFDKKKPSSTTEAEQGSDIFITNTGGSTGPSSPTMTTAPLLGSSPNPTVVDRFDHQTTALEPSMLLMQGGGDHMIAGNNHCSNSVLLNLAMLQYSFMDRPPRDDVAVGTQFDTCHSGGDDAIMALRMGLEEHGMGEIIEMEPAWCQGGSNCLYRDELYF